MSQPQSKDTERTSKSQDKIQILDLFHACHPLGPQLDEAKGMLNSDMPVALVWTAW